MSLCSNPASSRARIDDGDPEAIPDLLRRWEDGPADGADAIFAHYARRLTRVAEQHLSRKLAGRLDGEDVVQSVFRTFFRRSAAGEFRIDSSAQLWRLLVKITLLKARAKGRHHTAGDAGRRGRGAGGVEDGCAEAVAHEPGPAEAAALVDQIEALLRGLPPLHVPGPGAAARRATASPRSPPQLGVSRQTVHRVLGPAPAAAGSAPSRRRSG